jgi:hypothetical protein
MSQAIRIIDNLPEMTGSINDTQHGSRGGGSLHAVATTVAAGFMSAADKSTLNALVASGGHVIQDEGTPVTERAALNFVGAGVAVTDDEPGDASTVTIAGKHSVEDEGTPLTSRSKLNFVGSGVAVTDDSGDDATVVTINKPTEYLSFAFNDNGDAYFVAPVAMTLDTPVVGGTGTLSYAVALAADTTSFSADTAPFVLAAGDVLRVTVASITTYKAVTLERTA